jgi:ELWxxDGT repeat protein
VLLVTPALPFSGTGVAAPPFAPPGAGAYLVKDTTPDVLPGYVRSFTVAGDTLFFVAYDARGRQLWKSDGTEAGTVLVKDVSAGPRGQVFWTVGAVGERVFFLADDGVHGTELWKSDGTEAGTVMVRDICPGAVACSLGGFTVVGDTLFFWAGDDTHGLELWKSDGSEAGTALVKDVRPGPESSGLWALFALRDTLFFIANDGSHGMGLWKSDGTEAGTVMVKGIRPVIVNGAGEYQGPFSAAGDTLYFVADDGVHGTELWKSDGTEAGTVLVRDIRPGPEHSALPPMGAVGDTLFFSADDGVHGFELWKTDGTEAGTVLVRDIWPGPGTSTPGWYVRSTAVGGALYFEASDETHVGDLWRSDGTESGTMLVRDIHPGTGGAGLAELTAVGDRLYFRANDRTYGPELWTSDGTGEGTAMVQDICPGTTGSVPSGLTPYGGGVYFSAFEPVHGEELWAVGVPAQLRVSPHALRFGAVTRGGVVTVATRAQRVEVHALIAPLTWSVSASDPWLRVTGEAGAGTGTFAVSLDPRALPGVGASAVVEGTLTIETAGVAPRSLTLEVEVALYPEGTSSGPIGFLDTPADGATVSGAVAVTGWAADDIDLDVTLYRDAVPGDSPESISPNGLVLIAPAAFVEGSRPDVEGLLGLYPQARRAGWGYMLLTNALPDGPAGTPVGGNGSFAIHALATDSEGNSTLLGSTVITADNAGAAKPFGTIDVPWQGQTVAGTVAVFGWALTPPPAAIPSDGSTIWLVVDGRPTGQAVYGLYRADIASLFPGYANSGGAVGYSLLDTTQLSNGMHTIAWSVTDDLGRTEGLGSRFFWVQN